MFYKKFREMEKKQHCPGGNHKGSGISVEVSRAITSKYERILQCLIWDARHWETQSVSGDTGYWVKDHGNGGW